MFEENGRTDLLMYLNMYPLRCTECLIIYETPVTAYDCTNNNAVFCFLNVFYS